MLRATIFDLERGDSWADGVTLYFWHLNNLLFMYLYIISFRSAHWIIHATCSLLRGCEQEDDDVVAHVVAVFCLGSIFTLYFQEFLTDSSNPPHIPPSLPPLPPPEIEGVKGTHAALFSTVSSTRYWRNWSTSVMWSAAKNRSLRQGMSRGQLHDYPLRIYQKNALTLAVCVCRDA